MHTATSLAPPGMVAPIPDLCLAQAGACRPMRLQPALSCAAAASPSVFRAGRQPHNHHPRVGSYLLTSYGPIARSLTLVFDDTGLCLHPSFGGYRVVCLILIRVRITWSPVCQACLGILGPES